MVYYRLGKLMNYCGFDIPSPDTWRIEVSIEVDLLHPDIEPRIRQRIQDHVQHAFKKPGSTEADMPLFLSLLGSSEGFSKMVSDYNRVARSILDIRAELVSTAETSLAFTHTRITSRGEVFGGESNLLHQKFKVEEGSDIKAYIANAKDKQKAIETVHRLVIPQYVDNAVEDSNGYIVEGTIQDVQLARINWAMLNTDNFSMNNHPHAIELHHHLDEAMIIHNKLVNRESFTDAEKKTWGTERLRKMDGAGLFPTWTGIEFPHDPRDKTIGDGFIRKLKWRGSLALFTEEDRVPLFEEIVGAGGKTIRRWLVSPLLFKNKEDNETVPVGKLFFNARAKSRQILKAQGIEHVLDSQYILPENIVKELRQRRMLAGKPVLSPLILIDGVEKDGSPHQSIDPVSKEPMIPQNIAHRPNMRVIGLLEDEWDHNLSIDDAIKQGKPTPPALVETYFDVEEASKYPTPEAAIRHAVIPAYSDPWTKKAIKIPHHPLDIFYLELAREQKRHNDLITQIVDLQYQSTVTTDIAESQRLSKDIADFKSQISFKLDDFGDQDKADLLKKGIVSHRGEWEKIVEWEEYLRDFDGKFKSNIRALSDERFKDVMTFEETLLGFNKPCFIILRNYCTDPRTEAFYWKYSNHANKFRRLQDCILIGQNLPANPETISSIHRHLINRVYETGKENYFKDFFEKHIETYSSKIEERLPDLAIKIATDNFKIPKEDPYIKTLEAKKAAVSERYAAKNYEDLKDASRLLLKEYTGFIKTKYPFARMSNTPSPGFYYTESVNLGNQQENRDLQEDRANVEFYIKFLDFARLYLAPDFPEGGAVIDESKRQWVKPIAQPVKEQTKRRVIHSKSPTVDSQSFDEEIAVQLRRLLLPKPDTPDMKKVILEAANKRHATVQSKNRWGQPDLLRSEGDPMNFLIDIMTIIKNDVASFGSKWVEYAERMIAYAQAAIDVAIPHEPEDLLHSYEFPSVVVANDILWYLQLYYNIVDKKNVDPTHGVILYYTIDELAKGKAYLNIHVDIKASLTQRIDDYFKNVEDAEQFLKSPLSDALKRITLDLKWSSKITENDVRSAISDLLQDAAAFSKLAASKDGRIVIADMIIGILKGVKFKRASIQSMLAKIKDGIKLDKTGVLVIPLVKPKSLTDQDIDALSTLITKQLKDSPDLNVAKFRIEFNE